MKMPSMPTVYLSEQAKDETCATRIRYFIYIASVAIFVVCMAMFAILTPVGYSAYKHSLAAPIPPNNTYDRRDYEDSKRDRLNTFVAGVSFGVIAIVTSLYLLCVEYTLTKQAILFTFREGIYYPIVRTVIIAVCSVPFWCLMSVWLLYAYATSSS